MGSTKKVLAVIGCGRSGTHMLGYLLGTSPSVTTSIEDQHLFPLIVKSATRGLESTLVDRISRILQLRLERCETNFYLEKSHPLLWLAGNPKLYELPIKFIAINRDPYAVVASMIEHEKTRSWLEEWDKLPIPNIFLGVNSSNLDEYKRMSLAEKATMRWISHSKEVERLSYILGPEQYLVMSYEDLITNTKMKIKEIENFTKIRKIDKNFDIRADSLHKWQQTLSSSQVRQVAETLSRHY